MVLPANLATDDVIDEVWTDAVVDTLTVMTPTPWVAPALLNGWVNAGGVIQVAQYRKIGDRVFVRGEVKNGSNNTPVFQFPVGFRPPASLYFPALVAGGVAGGFLTLTADGNLTITTPTTAQVGLDICNFSVTP
jgi:hypothetical protein